MGTTVLRHHNRATLDFLKDMLRPHEVVDQQSYGATWYMVVRDKATDKYFGVVALTSKYKTELSIKLMSEDEMPYYYDAPERIIRFLNAQSPVDAGTNAFKWREKCLDRYHERRASGDKNNKRLRAGLRLVAEKGRVFRVDGKHQQRRGVWLVTEEATNTQYLASARKLNLLREA